MKRIIILTILISSCSSPSKTNNGTTGISKDTLFNDSISASKDSVIIYRDELDILKYPQSELSLIKKNYPELVDEIPQKPQEAYLISYYNSNEKNYRFGGEAGQDEFFILYAYFLKLRNGENKYKIQRERLILIYRTINDIYANLKHGGTNFGHQYKRIVGFVEYSIYSQFNNAEFYKKSYNYTRQKNMYIQSFKQLIKDEISIDNETNDSDKELREIEIMKKLKKLECLIFDYSDLKCAQEFQYSHY